MPKPKILAVSAVQAVAVANALSSTKGNKMKLVEIFARELEVWPEDAIRASYGADMNVYFEKIDGGIIETSYFTRGVDIPPFDVTRPQWQAERDRMETMRQPNELSKEDNLCQPLKNKDLPHVSDTNVADYDQELWDRVAGDSMSALMHSVQMKNSSSTYTMISQMSFDAADAFMAERAKRVAK